MNRAPARTVQLYRNPNNYQEKYIPYCKQKSPAYPRQEPPKDRLRDPACALDRLLSMKALLISRLGGPEVLQIQEMPDPSPAAGQQIVSAQAGGLNFADVMAWPR